MQLLKSTTDQRKINAIIYIISVIENSAISKKSQLLTVIKTTTNLQPYGKDVIRAEMFSGLRLKKRTSLNTSYFSGLQEMLGEIKPTFQESLLVHKKRCVLFISSYSTAAAPYPWG